MKYFATYLLIIFCGITNAQSTFPAGVANTYALGEKEGYNGFIYSVIEFAPDGTVYTCDYSGNVEIHFNNYSVKVDSLKKLGFITRFKVISPKEVWAMNDKHIAILINNRLSKVVALPGNILYGPLNADSQSVYVFTRGDNEVLTWLFNGTEFVKIGRSQINFTMFKDFIYEKVNGDIWMTTRRDTMTDIFLFNKNAHHFLYKKSYHNLQWINYLKDENNLFATFSINGKGRGCRIKNGKVIAADFSFNTGLDNSFNFHSSERDEALYIYGNGYYFTAGVDSVLNIEKRVPFILNDEISAIKQNTTDHFYYGLTGNRMLHISNWIKKYPLIFEKSNAAAIFTLREDSEGRIWAGSYKSNLAIIAGEKVVEVKHNEFKMTNGGTYYNGHMYLVGEGFGGLLQYDLKGKMKKVASNGTGFYTYLSNNKKHFYFTKANQLGVWQTSTKSLETLQPVWNKIDSTKGLSINNVLTIAEDTLGRIWCGHPRHGIAVYNPVTDKARSWQLGKNETAFGGMASLKDNYGTIWIGGRNGLWYYNDYSKDASPDNCIQINHPLLKNSKQITALTLYENWLVIAAYDKIVLLDLPVFYKSKNVVLRYLNPYEAAFTSFTEQNTLLTARDSSIWFSTSDMLYQWDIKHWLTLPTPKVQTTVLISGNNYETILANGIPVKLEPGFNSFDIELRYVSPDNMPRYTRAALVKAGDTILLPAPGLQNIYNIKNIAGGSYNFILEIFEMNGTTTRYVYPVIIKKFLWQLWWFWLLISTLPTTALLYLFSLKRKKQIAEQRTKTKEAELAAFKSDQEKKLANLQLVTLTSQFRPHFILNALNTIGAQMDDKPEAESVLSRLGESINLIFSHAQQQKILHPFENEWLLVKNVIHIHTLMYLKKLEVDWPVDSIIDSVKNVQVPMGILQIPVENALLHGLSNKENGPWHLSVSIAENQQFIVVKISDNGVGRKKSATLSNFTKHGTGTKNLNEIISIINAANKDKITLAYTDDIYASEAGKFGTSVIIEIPNQLHYGNE